MKDTSSGEPSTTPTGPDAPARGAPRQSVMVSVRGTRVEDNTPCTLLAIPEDGGTWMIHTMNRSGAVRLGDEQAARMATAILHLLGAPQARGVSE